jgi:Ca2+-binding EF-hand superfamily protein
MSLQDVMKTQQDIQMEQKAIRDEVHALSRRIDQSLKGDIQRLINRLDANEDKISKLSGNGMNFGGGDRSAPPMGSHGGRQPMHMSRPASSSGGYPGGATVQYGAPPAATRESGYGSGGSPGSPGGAKKGGLRRKLEDELQSIKQSITSVIKGGPKVSTWEEPAEFKTASSNIDRFELQFRNAIERSREYQKHENNPIQAVQTLFQRLDKNHSGKVDAHEMMALSKMLEFQADPKSMSALFGRFDLDHNGTLTIEEFSRSLFKLDGDTEYKAKSAIARMREVLAVRAGGFESCKAMGSQFRIIDRDRTGQLTKEEFNIALDTLFTAYNVKFTPAEKNALFAMFDFDKGGCVSYDEFTRGIRGDMSDFRTNLIKQAFAILDRDNSGIVDANDIGRSYDVSKNPAVMSGKLSPQDAIRQFMQHYDGNHDGKVSLEEFIESYQWISASIETDDYFELMIRNAWHITGGEGWCENTSNLRVLVKHGSAPDEVVEVKHDLGLPSDPARKYQEVIRRLQAQGVKDIQKVEFFG